MTLPSKLMLPPVHNTVPLFVSTRTSRSSVFVTFSVLLPPMVVLPAEFQLPPPTVKLPFNTFVPLNSPPVCVSLVKLMFPFSVNEPFTSRMSPAPVKVLPSLNVQKLLGQLNVSAVPLVVINTPAARFVTLPARFTVPFCTSRVPLLTKLKP